MILKRIQVQWLFLLFVFLASCKGQNYTDPPEKNNRLTEKDLGKSPVVSTKDTLPDNDAPNTITRSIIQDKSGNIWFATFGGIIKYDGHSCTNITSAVSSSRFFSVLEDSKGNFWFGSIGSGVYSYDGESFQNFTTNDGLVNNEIVCIYEDKTGDIWFGANGGVSRYDGDTIRNYIIGEDSMIEDSTGTIIPNLQRPPNEVNSIVEDKTGKYWFGTRGYTFVYDGKRFTAVTQNNRPFTNVRWIIEDKKGNIWLGGNDGLWQYDGNEFTNITKDFVGYIYEDKKGNIWTSSDSAGSWILSRYDFSSTGVEQRSVSEIKKGEKMFFGILEDSDGNIWVGSLNGVYQYDGQKFENFR